MGRPRHPNSDIEAAIAYAEALGWTCKLSNGHAWGRLFCPQHDRDGCIKSMAAVQNEASLDHYGFCVVLDGIVDLTEELERRLFEAGCNDATIALQAGRICLEFDRESPSLEDAVKTAIHDIRMAGCEIDTIRMRSMKRE